MPLGWIHADIEALSETVKDAAEAAEDTAMIEEYLTGVAAETGCLEGASEATDQAQEAIGAVKDSMDEAEG